MYQIIKNIVELIFPKICVCCKNALHKYEDEICKSCLFHLPRSFYEIEKNNLVFKKFWGKNIIIKATAHYLYLKKSNIQTLIHHLKYKNKYKIGEILGNQIAKDLMPVHFFDDIDLLIPVPLHVKKEKLRGYNQAEKIAFGISLFIKKDLALDVLQRIVFTETQTKKNVFNRWKNVESIFKIQNEDKIINKHILIIDDIITTGSTINSAISPLLKIKGVKVSVLCVAIARN